MTDTEVFNKSLAESLAKINKNDNKMLQFAASCYNISVEDLLNKIDDMENLQIINQHPYEIFQGNGKDKRFRTYVTDETKPNGRRAVAKATLEALHKVIISEYRKREDAIYLGNMTLSDVYEKWMLWRREIKTAPNTIRYNLYIWNGLLKENELSKLKMRNITIYDLENFFFSITENHAITFKRLSDVKSVLSGIYNFAMRPPLEIVRKNIVLEIDYKRLFRTRCRPSKSNKEIYSDEERKAILEYLEDKTDIYSLAILFAFRLCLRIGELIVVKKTDVLTNSLLIQRSIRRQHDLNDDFTFGKAYYDVEHRNKGNTTEGIREVTLTPKARRTALKAIELYPDGEYLFMRDGQPIIANTFNEYLKRICEKLNIKYRPSHQIRFTTATNLVEAGVPVNQISYDLGHCNVQMTYSYLRQRKMDDNSKAIAAQIQDI